MEMTWVEINELIDRNGPEILRRLVPLLMSPDVLKQLVKEEVLLDHQELTLRYIQDPSTRCTHFLDLVKAGSVQMYYNLVKVAKLNNQTDLVKLLEHQSLAQQSASLAHQPAPMAHQPAPMAQQPAPMAQPMPVEAREKEIHLWDKCHPDGETLLLMEPDLGRKLDIALPQLKKLVRPGDLWANLLKYGIMDSSNIEECQAAGVAGPQVEAIVKYLKQDLVWKLHAFFRALAQIKQDHLIDLVLGQDAKEAYNKNLLEDFRFGV